MHETTSLEHHNYSENTPVENKKQTHPQLIQSYSSVQDTLPQAPHVLQYLPMVPLTPAPPIAINGKSLSKRALNNNATKFKLNFLDPGALIRYEVIYKNLLRDMRKFFSHHFAETMSHFKSKDTRQFQEAVRAYVLTIFGKALLERFNISKEKLSFYLAALIRPKQMLQHQECSGENHDNLQVINIYFYLYKFSLLRMQQLLDSKPMTLLVAFYI